MNKEAITMGNGLDWNLIIKIVIIAVTLILVMGIMKSCVEQYNKDSIEEQKYRTPLEKCIKACSSATSDGSVLERDCINQCFEVEKNG